MQIPGVDDYPQSFDCPNAGTAWGPWGAGLTERLREDSPVFAAEYQGGSIDSYNAGYEKCRELTGPAFMKFFYKSNLMEAGATAFNYYMGFGGAQGSTVLDGSAKASYSSSGDLRLDYPHSGLARVLISGGGTAQGVETSGTDLCIKVVFSDA